jgi:hypothetical protein
VPAWLGLEAMALAWLWPGFGLSHGFNSKIITAKFKMIGGSLKIAHFAGSEVWPPKYS